MSKIDNSTKEKINEICKKFNYEKKELIEILHLIQKEFGCVDFEIAKEISFLLKISINEIFSVVTFYNEFKTERNAEHVFKVCLGTACKVMKSQSLFEFLKNELNIKENNKSPDNKFELRRVYCFGACSMAPVVEIDGKLYGHVTPDLLKEIISKLKE